MPVPLTELVAQLNALAPDARGAAITAFSGGLDEQLGLRFTWCAADRVVATLTAGTEHLQVYGLVHGGVYCTMVEAVGSCGAAMLHLPSGRMPVGVENQTRFVKASRAGATLTAVGTPESTTDVGSTWTVRITDQHGVLCAEGHLRARALEPGTALGGAALAMPDPTRDTDRS